MAQEVGYLLVCGYEAAQRGERLGERAHHKVHVVGKPVVVAYTTAAFAENAYRMRLVDHDCGIIFLGKLHNLGQVGNIAFHREHAVGNYQFDFVGLATLELLFEALHIVVLVLERLGERQTTTLDNRCVVLLVPKYVVLSTGKSRHNTEVDAEACRINHYIFFAYVLGDTRLKLFVKVESAVKKRRAGTARAVLAGSLYGRFLYPRVVDKTRIAIGPEHKNPATVDYHFGILFRRNCAKIRVYARSFSFLRYSIFSEFGL